MTDAQRIELEALKVEAMAEAAVVTDCLQQRLLHVAARIRALATVEPQARGQWYAREYHLGDYLGALCTNGSISIYRCGHRLERNSPLMRRAVEAAVDALEARHE